MPRAAHVLTSALLASLLAAPAAHADRIGPSPKDPPAAPTTDRVAALERQVRELQARVVALEAEVQRLRGGAKPTTPTPGGRRQLDSATRYSIPLADSPAVGPRAALVTLVATVQFPEPYTRKAWDVLEELRKRYKNDLRIVYKNFVVHPKAEGATLAVCAAGYQGATAPMAQAVWKASDEAPSEERWLSAPVARDLAAGLKLDMRRFDRDVATCATALARDRQLLNGHGQVAVPVFWINGRPLQGAQPIEKFTALVDEELATAKAAGAKPAGYYETLMKGVGAERPE